MVIISFPHTIMNIFVINEIFLPRKLYYVLIFPYGIYFMEYFFRCNGNFTIHMEKILHEIDSIWKNYYIIKFSWNKYYAGTNISSHYSISVMFLKYIM